MCLVDMLRQIQKHGSAHSNIYDNTVVIGYFFIQASKSSFSIYQFQNT